MSTMRQSLDTWLKDECVGKAWNLYIRAKSMLNLDTYLRGVQFSPIADKERRKTEFLHWTDEDIKSMEELKQDGYKVDKIIHDLRDAQDAVTQDDFNRAESILFRLQDMTIPIAQYECVVECQMSLPSRVGDFLRPYLNETKIPVKLSVDAFISPFDPKPDNLDLVAGTYDPDEKHIEVTISPRFDINKPGNKDELLVTLAHELGHVGQPVGWDEQDAWNKGLQWAVKWNVEKAYHKTMLEIMGG